MLEYECAGVGKFEFEYVCGCRRAFVACADDLEVEVVGGEEGEYIGDV